MGDKGYLLRSLLMMPVQMPETEVETGYNEAHAATLSVVEWCVDLLKMRLRCLERSGSALQYGSVWASRIIIVCCILHNIAQQRRDQLEEEKEEEEEERQLQDVEEVPEDRRRWRESGGAGQKGML